jgi:hypothetical protein
VGSSDNTLAIENDGSKFETIGVSPAGNLYFELDAVSTGTPEPATSGLAFSSLIGFLAFGRIRKAYRAVTARDR